MQGYWLVGLKPCKGEKQGRGKGNLKNSGREDEGEYSRGYTMELGGKETKWEQAWRGEFSKSFGGRRQGLFSSFGALL